MKQYLIILAFGLSFISYQAQETINGSIVHDGLERDYILYVPASYLPGSSLVMNFHGYGSNAFEQMNYGDFRPLADQYGFLLVHPDGTEDLTSTTHWNVGWGFSTVDDVGFISALIDSLHSSHTINLDQVYSTGMSNGGFFSYHLACNLSERIAAIASVTGAMNQGSFGSCSPSHPMPVMEIHGTSDPTVAYNGSVFFEGSEDIVNFWADFNDISAPPLVTPVTDSDPDDGCTAERWLFEGGTNGSTVELYKIFDGGHTWPGTDIVIGTTNQDFHASTVIWEFFTHYDINGAIIIDGVEELNKPSLKLWPNPSRDIIHLEGLAQALAYVIVDAQARVLQKGAITPERTQVDISSLAEGLYSIILEDGRMQSFIRD